jgi:hypothetical protein
VSPPKKSPRLAYVTPIHLKTSPLRLTRHLQELGDAAVVTGNPPGVVYEAVLPDEPFFPGVAIEGNVKGSIIATSAPDGVGVEFKVQFSNLPKEGGPFCMSSRPISHSPSSH